ncbi:hypothetical protein [Microbacterium sp. cf046]|uniref:hypothetical protein n=1 Tax=Microbacterium sp. cf046 TaxID=1761803 RepID=UPI0011138F9A|nr:hypothetical protein [Microbacterium sp. cf046]
MFALKRLAAAGAAAGLLLAGAAVSPATAAPGGGVRAGQPGEVIRVQIYERGYNGLWASDRFSGSCPSTHPYLVDKRFSNDRILPRGVIVTTEASVATLVVATSSETRIEGKKEFIAVKSVEGSWTNWGLGSGTVNITLECTNDWKQARLENQYG